MENLFCAVNKSGRIIFEQTERVAVCSTVIAGSSSSSLVHMHWQGVAWPIDCVMKSAHATYLTAIKSGR